MIASLSARGNRRPNIISNKDLQGFILYNRFGPSDFPPWARVSPEREIGLAQALPPSIHIFHLPSILGLVIRY